MSVISCSVVYADAGGGCVAGHTAAVHFAGGQAPVGLPNGKVGAHLLVADDFE
jgi:hypothetical protein